MLQQCDLQRFIVLQACGITLACVVYNSLLIRSMARHHMLLFTSFLAMPSALIRSMASRPCVVSAGWGAALAWQDKQQQSWDCLN